MQQQAMAANEKVKSAEPGSAHQNLLKMQAEYKLASQQLQQFDQLKEKLVKLYQMQGFKTMIKTNPNMSHFLGVIRQDFIKEGDKNGLSA